MWTIMEEGRDDYGRGFGTREGESEVEMAYREGCRHGYEKAMREAKEMMGQRGGYGERRAMPPYYPESPIGFRDPYEDEMGERYQYGDLDEYQPRINERRGRSAYTGRYVRR